MANEKSISRGLLGTSFLLMIIGLFIFLYAQTFTASPLFPQDYKSWNNVIGGYLLIFALSMIGAFAYAPEVVKSLTTANYWKAFAAKFIPSALVTIIVLFLLKGLLKGSSSINLLTAISYVPISVLIVHLFIVSQIEEILFGGLFYTAIEKKQGKTSAEVWSMIGFAGFHYAKTGGSLVVMATYIPLRYMFNYIRNNGWPLLNKIPGIGERFFGATPRTQQANAGVHFGWNLFVLSLIKPFQV